MSAHACGAFEHVKRSGCCTCCDDPVYEVREMYVEGPLAEHPRRIGPMLEHGTQVTMLLTDGSTADVTMCLTCAQALRPAMYPALWRACVERAALSLRLAGRSDNDRRVTLAHLRALWPMAQVGRRREAGDGLLKVDRR